jgi:hypothetical protein
MPPKIFKRDKQAIEVRSEATFPGGGGFAPHLVRPKPDLADEHTAYYRSHIGVPWGAFVFGRYNNAQQLCSTRR